MYKNRLICLLVNTSVLIALTLWAFLSTAHSVEPYSIYGTNVVTGEAVNGSMYDDHLNGSVNGVINDGPMTLSVSGEWTGKGQATLISIEPVNVYKVEVVE